jgi:hypothetical protein
MRGMHGTPLCTYVFTNSEAVFKEICDKCPSGSAVRNDALLHFAFSSIPIGGLGSSGMGHFHGKYTFDCFAHSFPVLYRPCAPGMDLNMIRYHPFGKIKAKLVETAMRLPYVPVLNIRTWTKVLIAPLAVRFIPGLQELLVSVMLGISSKWTDLMGAAERS